LFTVNELPEDENGLTLLLSNPRGIALLRETIRINLIDFVVIDTVSAAFYVENENDNSQVNQAIIQPVRKLARETGCAILLLHHFGKGADGPGNQPIAYRGRGASVFGANLPAIYALDNPQGKKNEDQRVTLRFAKVKRGEHRPDSVLLKP